MYDITLALLILCLVSRTQTVIINRIPEFIWGMHFGGNFTELCGIPCIHADNLPNPDAELLFAMNDGDVRNAINRQSDVPIRILGSHEGAHYYPLLKLEYLNEHFHGSAVLDWNSDVPWVILPNMDNVQKIQLPKDPIPKATFVARNCFPKNNRNTYAQEIDSVIGVVAPSNCLHNTEWPKCGERDCTKVEAIRNYKINLAFENGDSHNYVTEKIYHAFEAGVLPVYMGTREVSKAVPKGSYIDVADFDSPNNLALYLAKVLANDTLYQSYFEWKYKPFDEEYVDRFRVLWSEPFNCRLCRYVDAFKNHFEWDQHKQRATTTQVESTTVAVTADNNITVAVTADDNITVAVTADDAIFLKVDFNRRYGYILVCFVVLFVICFRKRIYDLFVKLGRRCF